MNTKIDAGQRGSSRMVGPSAFSAVLGALLPIAPAGAQQDAMQNVLAEVIVTAQKREERLQDVAVSMSAVTGEEIEAKGMVGFRDWSTYVPGMTMYEGTNANRRAGPTAVIRGVAQQGAGSLSEVAANATTNYTFGQVPMFSGDPGLYDIQRIEVLKGPQGTLFGVASMGGTIRFIPGEAQTKSFASSVALDVGSIDEGGNVYRLEGMVNVPIIEDVLAVRAAGQYRRNEGFIDLHVLGLDMTDATQIRTSGWAVDPRSGGVNLQGVISDANYSESTSFRASVTYTPTDRITIKAFAMTAQSEQQNKQIIDITDQSEDWVTTKFTTEPQDNRFEMASLEASYDFGFGSLQYVGGYSDSKLVESVDVTTFPEGLGGTGANAAIRARDADGPGGLPPDPYPSPTQFPFTSPNRIASHELRLEGQGKPLFGGLTFDYVVGAFKMTEDKVGGGYTVANPTWNSLRGPNTVPILTEGGLMSGWSNTTHYKSEAVFGDLALNLTSKLSVSAGVRQSDHELRTASYTFGDFPSGVWANGFRVGDNLNVLTRGYFAFSEAKDIVTPRYSASYRFDDERMIYATASNGKRMAVGAPSPDYWDRPGVNPVCRNIARTYGIEDDAVKGTHSDSVWSYDLGLRSTWLDRRLKANAAVFLLKWSELQRAVQLHDFDITCFDVISANVGVVEVKGFEFEMAYLPIDALTVSAAISYTDAEVAEDEPGVKDSLGQALEKGDEIQSTSPWKVAIGVEYRAALPVLNNHFGTDFSGFFRVDWRYVDENMGSSMGDKASLKADPLRRHFIAPSYELTDIRFGVVNDAWTASLYISNVFNEKAVFESFRAGNFPNQTFAAINQPRTIGLGLKRSF